jgi:hypothetical protein
MRNSRDTAADQALACALPAVSPQVQNAIIDILLEHQHEEGLIALPEAFHLFDDANKTRVVAHTARLFSALRLTVRSPLSQTRLNSLEIIRRSENPRLAYLAASCVHDGSTHIRADAATTLRGLTDRHCTNFEETTRTLHEASNDRELSPSIVQTLRLVRDERQHLLAALREALNSFESHHRPEVLEAAMFLPDELESSLFQVGTLKRGKLTQAMVEIFNNDLSPRMAPFAYIALCYPELRRRIVSILSTMKSGEFFAEFIRYHWLAHDPTIRRNLSAVRSLNWLGDGMQAAFSLPPDAAAVAPHWIMHLGLPPDQKISLLRQFLLIEHPAANRAAVWSLVQMDLPGSTAALAELVEHEDANIRRIAQAEMAHRRRSESRGGTTHTNRPAGWAGMLERAGIREDFNELWLNFDRLDPAQAAASGHFAIKFIPGFQTQVQVRLLSPQAADRLRGLRFISTLNIASSLVNDICNMANDPNAEVRAGAMTALGRQGQQIARRILIRGLNDDAPQVQVAAIDALETMDERTRGELVAIKVQSDDAMVRAAAIRVLLRLHQQRAATSLLSMLSDTRFEHRCSALWIVDQLDLHPLSTRVAEMARGEQDHRVARIAQHVLLRLQKRRSGAGGARPVVLSTEAPI